MNGGERRVGRERVAVIAETDDGEPFGNAPTQALRGEYRQHAGNVVDGKRRSWTVPLQRGRNGMHIWMVGKGRQAEIVPGADQVTGDQNDRRLLRRDAGGRKAGAKAAFAVLYRRNMVTGPADHRQPAVPQAQQMFRHQAAASDIIGRDQISADAGDRSVNQHERDTAALEMSGRLGSAGVATQEDDQPIGRARCRVNTPPLQSRIAKGVGDLDTQPGGAPDLLYAVNDVRDEVIAQARDDADDDTRVCSTVGRHKGPAPHDALQQPFACQLGQTLTDGLPANAQCDGEFRFGWQDGAAQVAVGLDVLPQRVSDLAVQRRGCRPINRERLGYYFVGCAGHVCPFTSVQCLYILPGAQVVRTGMLTQVHTASRIFVYTGKEDIRAAAPRIRHVSRSTVVS